MKRIIACVAMACLVFTVGCKTEKAEKPEPAIKKLLARTDIVLVKHFYEDQTISGDQDPKNPDVRPGSLSLEPIWVYEPGKERSGEKGASLTLVTPAIWMGEGNSLRKEGGEEHTAFLDLKELRDLDNALDFFESDASPWRTQQKSGLVEVSFESKDDFDASIFRSSGDQGDVLFLTIESKSLALNAKKAAELQQDTRNAIAALDKL
jgi:hypothetical protein